MKLRSITYLIILLPLYAMPQVNKTKNEVSMGAGIMTSQTYDTRLSYLYYLNKNIGIGASIGFYQQWHANNIPQGDLYNQEWDYWKLSEKDYKPQNIYIEPSFSIRTPTITNVGKWSINIGADFGVILQVPYTSVSVNYVNTTTQVSQQKNKYNGNMQWVFWDVRPTLKLENNSIFIAIGYSLSNLDVYSSYREIKIQNIKFNDFYPKKKLNHTVFLKVGGYF